MSLTLPELQYDYDALEPFIDEATMKTHHQKHHAGYLSKFNEAIKGTDLKGRTQEEIFANVSEYGDAVRNFGGGFYNHSFFWKILTPDSTSIDDVNLADAIVKYFGTLKNLKEEFITVALNQFGSGWAWLIKKYNGELLVYSTENQDNPLMDVTPINGKPLLCVDVWEHAYYLKYQNDRAAYLNAFWNVVNWEKVADLYNIY